MDRFTLALLGFDITLARAFRVSIEILSPPVIFVPKIPAAGGSPCAGSKISLPLRTSPS